MQKTGQRPARERMAHLLLEGRDAGVLSEDQGELLNRAIAIRDQTVGEEMVPWSAIHTLTIDASTTQRHEAIASPWTRFPVVNQQGQVAGVVSVLDLHFHPDTPASELMSEPLRLTPQQTVPEGSSVALSPTRNRDVGTLDNYRFHLLLEDLSLPSD